MTPHSPTLFLASGEVLLALQKFLLRATTLARAAVLLGGSGRGRDHESGEEDESYLHIGVMSRDSRISQDQHVQEQHL